ncbi:hypothetical protein HOF92_05630 [bacterium]|jgi:hypothetical protein|nr:hypothetical protein [bacterium]
MTVIEYLNKLIEDRTWDTISPLTQRIFLAILARSQGGRGTLEYDSFRETTGLDSKEEKKVIEELVEKGFLQYSSNGEFALVESLDHSSMAIPLPPYNAPKEAPEFLEALRNLVSGQWTGILGGALMVYVVQTWFDYIYRMDHDDSDHAHDTLSSAGVFDGFQELESIAYKELSRPLHLITPLEWSAIIVEAEERPPEVPLTSTDVEAMFARLGE